MAIGCDLDETTTDDRGFDGVDLPKIQRAVRQKFHWVLIINLKYSASA